MVKFNNLSLKLKNNKILTVFDRVIKSGLLILGSEVKNFETAFANYLKIDHCITVANGTDAIEIGLKSGGVKPNDKVATVANAGAYTTTSILAIGASPIFMDIDEKTMLTSFEQVKKAYSKGARAVVITHLFGSICPDIVKISKFCEKNNVLLFEDCAQCHGLELDGKKAGTFGNIASFSFYPTKNLGALGDGGAIVTNNHKYADLARSLRQYGWSKKYYISNQGGRNSRLDELQAAVLLLFLPDLDKSNKKRRHVAYRYNNEIKNSNIDLPNFDTLNSVFHLYVVKSKKEIYFKNTLLRTILEMKYIILYLTINKLN